MIDLNKDNIQDILYTFNKFHDGSITSVNYDVIKNEIEIIIECYKWNEYTYSNNIQPKNAKVIMFFKNIEKFEMHEFYYWDFIFKSSISISNIGDQSVFTFYDDEESKNIAITCKEILFNEIK